MFEGFWAKIFGTKPAATDKKAVANPVANPAAATNVNAQVPHTLSSEAAVAAGGQKGGSRRRRRRSCGKSKKGGQFTGMGVGRVGGKSHRRSKKRNTHKRRK